MFSVAGILIVVAATITTTSQKSQGYFCPYGELLIDDKCYTYHKTSLTQPEAQEFCQENDRTLPSEVQEHLTGWVKDTPGAWAGLTDSYCVAGFPDPAGQVDPEELVYQLGPCSHQLHVVCAKEFTNSVDQSTCVDKNPICKDWAARDLCDNPYLIKNCWKSCGLCVESDCPVDMVKVAITLDGTETSYCVQSSTEKTSGGKNIESNICPDGMSVLGFDFGTTNGDIEIDTSASDDAAVARLSKLTFWTPYLLKQGTKVITDKDGATHGQVLNSCLYQLYSSALRVGSCQTALPFYCEASARKISDPEDSEDGEVYDPAKEYFCEDDEDVLCKERCFKHRKVYSTLKDATSNCTGDGYKLVSGPTAQSSCAGYRTGWVSGVNYTYSAAVNKICVSVFDGEMLVGDCRKQLPVLCQEHSYDGNCPSGFEKCGDNSSCVRASEASYGWDAGVTMRSACTTSKSSTSSILSSSKAMESCSIAAKKLSATTAHWIGAGLAQNNVVEYINGDAIDSSDLDIEKKCLSIFGGKLVRSTCDTLKQFACEKRASITDPPGNPDNTAVIVVLVIAPIGLVAAILVLVYKRRNIEVCFGGATADEEEQNNYDNVVVNPVVVIKEKQTDKQDDQELIIISPAKKQGAENNEEDDDDHIYADMEPKPIDI